MSLTFNTGFKIGSKLSYNLWQFENDFPDVIIAD